MYRRGAPRPIITINLRDTSPVDFSVVHGVLRTPAIGLRQGCSLSFIIFRWCMEDLASGARARRQSYGQGLAMDDVTLRLLAWADDVYVFATDMDQVEARFDDGDD